jgi:hypothetical protein
MRCRARQRIAGRSHAEEDEIGVRAKPSEKGDTENPPRHAWEIIRKYPIKSAH